MKKLIAWCSANAICRGMFLVAAVALVLVVVAGDVFLTPAEVQDGVQEVTKADSGNTSTDMIGLGDVALGTGVMFVVFLGAVLLMELTGTGGSGTSTPGSITSRLEWMRHWWVWVPVVVTAIVAGVWGMNALLPAESGVRTLLGALSNEESIKQVIAGQDLGWLAPWLLFLLIPFLLWWHQHFTDEAERKDLRAPRNIAVLGVILVLLMIGNNLIVVIFQSMDFGWNGYLEGTSIHCWLVRVLLAVGAVVAGIATIIFGQIVFGLALSNVLWLLWIAVQA